MTLASLAGDRAETRRAIADVESRLLVIPGQTARGGRAYVGSREDVPGRTRCRRARKGDAAGARDRHHGVEFLGGQRVVSRLVKAAFAIIELEHAVRLLRAYEIAPDDDAVLLALALAHPRSRSGLSPD